MITYKLDNVRQELSKITNSLAKSLMPIDEREVLGWAAELWLRCPPYRQGIIKGSSYFLTEVAVSQFPGTDIQREEIQEASLNMNRMFATTDQAALVIQEALGFGGSCTYLHLPFSRRLVCECGAAIPCEQALREHGFSFSLETMKYSGTCVACKKRVVLEASDSRMKNDVDDAKLRRIPLPICRMDFNPITGSRRLFFKVSDWEPVYQGIMDKNPLFLAETPAVFIESAVKGRELMLDEEYFHYIGFEDASIIDVRTNGWGLPPFFYAFSDVLAILLLQNYNETLLSDYIEPKRYVAPPPTINAARSLPNGKGFDTTHMMSSGDFASRIGQIISGLRNNPGKIAVLPFPIESGYIAKSSGDLVSVELMQHYIDSLMLNMGIPSEFYRGGVGAQVALPSHYGFVLYEKTWKRLVSGLNGMYQWVSDRTQEIRGKPRLQAALTPPSRAASPEMITMYLQRNAEGRLSHSTLDNMIGVNTEYETRTVRDEVDEQIELDRKAMKDDQRKGLVDEMVSMSGPMIQAYETAQQAEQMQMEQGAPGAGAPVAGPPPADPSVLTGLPEGGQAAPVNAHMKMVADQLNQKAMATAQQFMQYPIPDRSQMLRDLEAAQPTYHMFVTKAIEQLEADAEKQGLDAARGQAQ